FRALNPNLASLRLNQAFRQRKADPQASAGPIARFAIRNAKEAIKYPFAKIWRNARTFITDTDADVQRIVTLRFQANCTSGRGVLTRVIEKHVYDLDRRSAVDRRCREVFVNAETYLVVMSQRVSS